jgi:PEP-CTERM motif
MKPTILRTITIVIAFVGSLLFGDSATAAVISPINSPASSFSTISFVDTNSMSPSLVFGGTYNQTVTPWGGTAPINNTLPLTTDPIGDFAKGNITANVIGGNYSLALNTVLLNQAPLNRGFADLIFTFSVEFQLDAAGLPSQPTVFPNFLVNGTVQNPAGSFAAVKGFINYSAVNTAGTVSILDTVNYNALFNTPGNFSGTVVGVPVNGTTPTLAPNTTLTLSGMIDFTVDPANISVETVPEPSAIGLAVLGLLGVVGLRHRSV